MATENALSNEQIRLLLHFHWMQSIHYEDAANKINEVYGEKTVGRSTANKWYGRFQKEGMELGDKERSGRPREIDRQAVLSAIEENPTATTRMLAEDFSCGQSSIVEILQEAGIFFVDFLLDFSILGLVWKKTRWLPHELTEAQKQKRVDVSTKLLERQQSRPFLQDLITMDETWIPFYNPDPKSTWGPANHRPQGTPKPDFRCQKIMLSVFWGPRGIIYW
jgi:histone-lysine N-methyltransferase SETMAR